MEQSTENEPAVEEPQRPGRRLPDWLRIDLPAGNQQVRFRQTRAAVSEGQLHTVCEEARCPNIHDCWARGTATFMIAGRECTRGCRFCSVETLRSPSPPDPNEPEHLAEAVARMELRHVVITVVNRDDLPDGGADHYRQCVLAVHYRTPDVSTELLSSDLDGNFVALEQLLDGLPLAVFAHNVECVERLDKLVRDPRASFQQSLEVLAKSKCYRSDLYTKSSLMIGLGETDAEVSDAMRQLREVDVDLLTLGQYIAPGRPGSRFLDVDRYVPPEQFAHWAEEARKLGFLAVASAPMVRSSFRAGALLAEAQAGRRLAQRPDTGQGSRSPSAMPNVYDQPVAHGQVSVSVDALVASAAELHSTARHSTARHRAAGLQEEDAKNRRRDV